MNQADTIDEALLAARTPKSIVNALPLALVRARESVMMHFRQLLRRYHLTEPQWRVLRTVDSLAPVELTELSRVTALLMPSLSRIVRELEQRGYLMRGEDRRDMRRTLASLTPKGRRLVMCVGPQCEAIYEEIRNVMGHDKICQLQKLLLELETRVGAISVEECVEEVPDEALPAIAKAKQRGRPPK